MLKRTISVLLAALVLCPSALAHTATVADQGTQRYKTLRLTPEVYAAASADLSDLRLWDGAGEAVPYFLHSATWSQQVSTERYPMTRTDAFYMDETLYLDYAVTQPPQGRDVVATSVAFATRSTDFAKGLEILGSHDGVNWTPVGEDTLYRVEGKAKLETVLPGPQKYTHYRFGLSNNLEEISFDEVTLCYSAAAQETGYFLQQLRPSYTVAQDKSRTVVTIAGVKHLRLTQVTLETDSTFQRTASVLGQEKQLYHLSFGEASYVDTTMTLDRVLAPAEHLILTIENGDDRPIDITGIQVEYAADELVFEGGGGGPYTLEFDSASGRSAPVYDIGTYSAQILTQPMDRLEIQRVTLETPPPAPPPAPDYNWAFQLAVIVAALVLGAVILVRLRAGNGEREDGES